MRCEQALDDGAYVLGALSPAERASYERHLSTCAHCREAVAEIAVLPGLLGRLDPAAAAQLLTDDGSMLSVEPLANREMRSEALVTAAAAERRRDKKAWRLRFAGVGMAAACLVIAAVFSVVLLRSDSDPPEPGPGMQAMEPVATAEIPMEGNIGLRSTDGGTVVSMECWYDKKPGYEGKAWVLRLYAYGPDGASEQIGSWVARPGDVREVPGVTRFKGSDLVKLAVTNSEGETLLQFKP